MNFHNPDPSCDKECSFGCGPSMTTAAYYPPVYDKHGNNINPDMNTTSAPIWCYTCGREWVSISRGNDTAFKLTKDNSQT